MSKLKKEDVPIIGGIIFDAFVQNKADFLNFSNIFDDPFEAEMAAAIKEVFDRRRPADVFDKQRKVTINLYAKIDEMQEQLRLLGDYVIFAEENLQSLYKHYHIIEARRALHSKNVEGVIEHCNQIIDKITTDDAVALSAVGFNAARLTIFENLLTDIINLNKEQVSKMNERQNVKAAEDIIFENMYEYIDKVTRVGKSMYTYKEKQKYDDFSINSIKANINHGRKRKTGDDNNNGEVDTPIYDVMLGKIYDKITDQPLENVVVRIEGTEIITETDEDGEFYIDEIPKGIYTVSFAKMGYTNAEQHNLEIGSSTMHNLTIELLPADTKTV